jgi:hypothetical protein
MTESPVLYESSTDTMLVELRPWPGGGPHRQTDLSGGEDAGEDLVVHYGPDGLPYAWEIENASRHPEHIAAALRRLQQSRSHAAE